MTELMKWRPFRFARGLRRPVEPTNRGNGSPAAVTTMRDEMAQMFDRFWTNPLAVFDAQDRWFGDFSSPDFQPRLDVTDDKDALRVAVEVPGVDGKDLAVEVQDGVLTVLGEKKQESSGEDEVCYHTERSYGCFRRSIPLPAEVDSTKAEARFDKGVLTVRLPKTERARQQSTRIAIKT
jgi:HSP20 family protein